jgi:hypothetical protein
VVPKQLKKNEIFAFQRVKKVQFAICYLQNFAVVQRQLFSPQGVPKRRKSFISILYLSKSIHALLRPKTRSVIGKEPQSVTT